MEITATLVKQVLMMFLLVGIGYALYRTGRITEAGSKTLGNLLVTASLPAVIINSFLIERTAEHMLGLLISAACAAVILAVSILISRLCFKGDPIAAFAGAFSNPGFFGVPLIVASIGQGAVFYVACFIAFLNILQWTYGVAVMTGRPARQYLNPRKIATAPFAIAIAVGLFLFLTQLPLPAPVSGCISAVAGLNTPLAMFATGAYLAQTDILRMLRRGALYRVSLVRLVVIPLVTVLMMLALPRSLADMKLALLLAAACPVGSNVAVYAQLNGKDYAYAVETVIISTLLSIATIPAMAWLASAIW